MKLVKKEINTFWDLCKSLQKEESYEYNSDNQIYFSPKKEFCRSLILSPLGVKFMKWALDMSIEVKKLTGTTIGLALHCKQ